MITKPVKCLVVAAFSVFTLFFSQGVTAQEHGNEPKHEEQQHKEFQEKAEGRKFDAGAVIFGHISNAHEFHFFSWKGSDGHDHHATIPLPVILYSPQKGFSVFSSSRFEHGHATHDGYKLVGNKIEPLEAGVQVYDLSLTRNVVQMLLALSLLVWIMTSVAAQYRKGQGVTTAPKGMQNLMEPVITFVRDEVAKPNLGPKYNKYLPYLLTVFFFILINSLFGLLPGSANVTGNIFFTLVMALVSFLVILFSSNKYFWGHIFNPPVPFGIKFIMVPVEILGIFTKPMALMIRLFANMMAGHIIIICLISLIFIFGSMSEGVGWGFTPVSLAFTVFIYMIEILVAFIQAFIFTNLTAVFIGQAFESHGHGDEIHV
jgi:F-type H+-transporting ATPase subunit a